MISINSNIEEITNQGIFLHESYCLWQNLAHPNLNAEYERILCDHEEFKKVFLESLFGSIVTSIYMLCDKRADALSLHCIIAEVESTYPDLREGVEEILSPIDPELELLAQIRHKVYAHRDRNISPQSVFSLVNMSPERIYCCISSILSALDLINWTAGIKSQLGVTTKALSKSDETENSLSTLLL
ncbi:MAG: hypothetical protein V3T17_05845 [Pseudomonadales bacterium]